MSILFLVSCAEFIGLSVYLHVYNNLDATACCGIIAHSDEYYENDHCNERSIDDDDSLSWTDVTTSSGSTVRICTVNEHRCDTGAAVDGDIEYLQPLSSCFQAESDYAELCGGWKGLQDAEHHAGSEARLWILISLLIMSLDILLAISELIIWRSECKGKEAKEWCCIWCIRGCMDCRCLWMPGQGKGCSYFLKLSVWIYMYYIMNEVVEGALENGYYGEGSSGYSDGVYVGIAEEAADECGLNGNGFLTLKYHAETPVSVDNGVYEMVTNIGLLLAIIQFLFGFCIAYCSPPMEDPNASKPIVDEAKVDKMVNMAESKVTEMMEARMAKMFAGQMPTQPMGSDIPGGSKLTKQMMKIAI